MRSVTLTQARPDCLAIVIGRDRRRALLAGAGLAVVSGLMLLPTRGTFASWLALALGAAAMVVIGLALGRALAVRSHLLARSAGRLLLDTEPLELARVELKVTVTLLQRPTGYVLTLWVMTASGPEELLLGNFPTLLEATRVSGLLEDFVQRANVKQHRLA